MDSPAISWKVASAQSCGASRFHGLKVESPDGDWPETAVFFVEQILGIICRPGCDELSWHALAPAPVSWSGSVILAGQQCLDVVDVPPSDAGKIRELDEPDMRSMISLLSALSGRLSVNHSSG
jgi:hypothetical protein